jgi:hypothetical protein
MPRARRRRRSLDGPCPRPKTTGRWQRDVVAAAAFAGSIGPDERPMTAARRRLTAARPTSEQAPLEARSCRSEATVADLASATVLRSLDLGVALAKLADDGMVRRSTGRKRLRRAPHRSSMAAEQARRTGDSSRAAAGRPARRPCARLRRPIARHRSIPTNCPPVSRTEPGSKSTGRPPARKGEVSTDEAAESPGGRPHALVGARFRHQRESDSESDEDPGRGHGRVRPPTRRPAKREQSTVCDRTTSPTRPSAGRSSS